MRWILAVSRHTFLPDGGWLLRHRLEELGTLPSAVLIHHNASAGSALRAVAAWCAGARGCGGALIRSLVGMRTSPWEGDPRIPVHLARDLNAPGALRFLRDLRPELGVHVRTRCFLGPAVLECPRLGWVNVHHGLLPRDRGTSCDLHELRGHRPAGFSLHQMTARVDSGEILETVVVDDGSCRDYPDYLRRSSRLEADAIHRLLDRVGRTESLPQGVPNACDQPAWFRTPGWEDLRTLVRREGFRL